MNAGVYCLSRDIFDYVPGEGSFESITLPLLAREDKLLVTTYPQSVRWRSIDSHKDIDEAQIEFAELAPKARALATTI
jgi:NDP-sugar pyrophosphorylase family protein